MLTLSLWAMGRHFIRSAEYAEFKELLAKKEHGGGALRHEVELLEKIISKWPREPEAHIHLARGYRRAGEADNAIRVLDSFLKRLPENNEARMEFALCYLAKRDFARTRREFEAIVKRQPEHAEAARKLAVLLMEQFADEVEDIERAIRASLKLQPEDRLLRYHLAKICRQKGAADEAAGEMVKVLEPPPTDRSELTRREAAALGGTLGSKIHLLAAELKVEEGKLAAAIPLLEASLKLSSANVSAGMLLAGLYIRSDQAEKAGRLLSDLARRAPTDARVWELLAEFDLAAGRVDAYVKDLRRLYALRPDDKELAMKLFEGQLNAGDLKGAGVLLEELSLRGDKRALELRARLALEEGKPEEARSLLKKLAAADPDEPSVAVMLARIEKAAGRLGEAAAMLSKVVRSGRAGAGLEAVARLHLGLTLWQAGDARSAAAEFENVLDGGGSEDVKAMVGKFLKLARGQVPDVPAVKELSWALVMTARPERVPGGVLGITRLSRAKSLLSAFAFGKGQASESLGRASGTVLSRGLREHRWAYFRRCIEEAARSEIIVARALAQQAGVAAPQILRQAESAASGGGAAAEAMRLALAAQLEMLCRILEKDGMKPASTFLRRKSAALAAIQDSAEAKAAVNACVVAEGLACVLSAGKAGWAYERAARNVVNALHESCKGEEDVLEQLRNAERAHVLLVNMLVLKRRDAKLLSGP